MKIIFFFATYFLIAQVELHSQDSILIDRRDGKLYKIIQSSSQVWMAQNLAYGNPINHTINHEFEYTFCYGDSAKNCEKCGMLYSWKVALNVCPQGWHLPSKKEYETLLGSLGADKKVHYQKLIENGIFTQKDLGGWLYVLKHTFFGRFVHINDLGVFWTSTEINKSDAFNVVINRKRKKVLIYGTLRNGTRTNKWNAASVRCVKD